MPGQPTRGPARPDESAPLVLPLPIEAPGPPRRIEPEEALACEAPFDGDEWLFGVDWDGIRVICRVETSGQVRLHDARLRDVSARFPEVAAAARTASNGRATLLDGVVTILDESGSPDLSTLMGRVAEATLRAAPVRGVVFLVTDLLHLDAAALLGWPLERRRAALLEVVRSTPHVQVPDVVIGHGRAVAEAAGQRGLAGILARHAAAPYMAGVISPRRLRVPIEDRADAVVVGVVLGAGRGGQVTALLLAEWDDGRLVDAGRCAVEADAVHTAWLRSRIAALRTSTPPLAGIATGEEGSGVTWVTPSLVATVRHHGRGDDGRLRLAAPVALREDRPVRWCIRRPPVAPPAARPAVGREFRPTVITTLPLGE